MGWIGNVRRNRGLRALLLPVFFWTMICRFPTPACDTPVYRYALYRWEPAPYEVFCFHRGDLDQGGARLQALVEAAQRSTEKPANIGWLSIDLAKDPDLKTVPAPVREAWQAQKDAKTPFQLVFTPHGQKLFAGSLDESTLQALLASPARDELVKQLAAGKAGVLVLLAGPDEKANAAAEKLLRDTIQEIAAGKVPLYTPPVAAQGKEPPGEAAPKLDVGWVKLARNDARERWLVDALLSLEEDLRDERYAKAAMVFPVFGRGRALPPCLGPGITRDNLIACVDFITGACSCTVKDQNPGLDLLLAHDWIATAEKLAAKFGQEEGNEAQLGAAGLFPQLMIPAEAAKAKDAGTPLAGDASGTKREEAEAAGQTKPGATNSAQGTADHEEPGTAGASQTPRDKDKPAAEPAAAPSPVQAAGKSLPEVPSVFSSAFVIGSGVAVALVLLFGLTFFVLRPR
jgi:hypothetical protein